MTAPTAGLDGPSRTIIVEPVEQPQAPPPERREEPKPAPQTVPDREREPVPA